MSGTGAPDRKEKAVDDGQARDGAPRRSQKSDAAFRTISEVAAELDVPQHVLRFWETKFTQIRPMKRGGGRRYYRPEDVVLLTTLRDLLYHEGYTIKGVQKLLRENGVKALVATVQDRRERSDGGAVGPVGMALSDQRAEDPGVESRSGSDAGPDSSGVDAEADADAESNSDSVVTAEGSLTAAGSDTVVASAPEATSGATAAAEEQTGLSPETRAEIETIVEDLAALQGLVRQALDRTRPPPPPPEG